MLTKYLSVFLISMVPLIELRGAIPVGVAMGLPLWQVYVIAIIGNMLPVPFIFFFARKVLEWGADKPVNGGPRSAVGAAAVRRHSAARHGCVDRHAGRQPFGHGL